MPVAINTYILKTTSFCNINCSYCYMFGLKDTTFRGKTKVMPLEVMERAAAQMAALARQQGVKKVLVGYHGGEPMLAGPDWFRQSVGLLRKYGGDDVSFLFSMQTNALLIDDEWLDLFEQYRFGVGVSLDGPRHVNDRARLNFAGRSTYDATVAGLQKLRARRLLGGILCVMDPRDDGLEVYEHFLSLGANHIDFLWPLDHNWDAPPASLQHPDATPYADYLIPIFDAWWSSGNGKVAIRYFENIVQGLMGAQLRLDALGGNPISTVIIDSDGGLEPLDVLRSGDDGLTNVGLNLATNQIIELYGKELFQKAIAGRDGLCSKCRDCPLMTVCGGGYLPHRYSHERGFDNPSVYCRDLWKLISHIAKVLAEELRKSAPTTESAVA